MLAHNDMDCVLGPIPILRQRLVEAMSAQHYYQLGNLNLDKTTHSQLSDASPDHVPRIDKQTLPSSYKLADIISELHHLKR